MENKEYTERVLVLENKDDAKVLSRLDDDILLLTLVETLEQTKKQLKLIDQLKKQLFYGRESTYVEKVRETTNKEVIQSKEMQVPLKRVRSKLHGNKKLVRLLHGVLGVASEVEELVDAFLASLDEIDEVNWKEELGDCFFYQALIADVFNFSFEDIQKANVEKLELRYRNKDGASSFNEDAANNRDLDKERKALESDAQS